MAEYMRHRRINRRGALIELAGSKCRICGLDELSSLDFHHRDRTTKKFGLSGCGLDKSWDTILEEYEKCDLLCMSCHLDETRRQWQNKELVTHNSKRHIPYEHGTMRCYHEDKCRCNKCRLAKMQYRNKIIGYDQEII